MNEIEVKAKLKDKDVILGNMNKSGAKILSKKYQKDVIFWPNDIKEFNEHTLGVNFLRIRKQDSGGQTKILFTLKQPQTNQTDCIEHEIEIRENDIEGLRSIIETLGFHEFVTIEKTREGFKLGDVEICLDNVTDLGSFIELEKFGPGNKAKEIQQELYSLLESWGIKKEDFVYDGYDILLHNHKKNL